MVCPEQMMVTTLFQTRSTSEENPSQMEARWKARPKQWWLRVTPHPASAALATCITTNFKCLALSTRRSYCLCVLYLPGESDFKQLCLQTGLWAICSCNVGEPLFRGSRNANAHQLFYPHNMSSNAQSGENAKCRGFLNFGIYLILCLPFRILGK